MLIIKTIQNYRSLRKSWAWRGDSKLTVLRRAFELAKNNVRY